MNGHKSTHQFNVLARFAWASTSVEILLVSLVLGAIVWLVPLLFDSGNANSPEASSVRDPIFRIMLTSNGKQLWIQRGICEAAMVDVTTGVSRSVYRNPGAPIINPLVSEDGTTSIMSLDEREIVISKNGELMIDYRIDNDSECGRMALSANGQTAAVIIDCQKVRIWNLSGEEPTWSDLQIPETIDRIALNTDGRQVIVSTNNHELHRYDLKTGCRIQVLPPVGPLTTEPMFSHDGSRLVVVTADTVAMFDLNSGEVAWKYQNQNGGLPDLRMLAFSPDNRRIAVAGHLAGILILDAANGRIERTLNPPYVVGSMAFSASSDELYISSSNTIRIWPFVSGDEARLFNVI